MDRVRVGGGGGMGPDGAGNHVVSRHRDAGLDVSDEPGVGEFPGGVGGAGGGAVGYLFESTAAAGFHRIDRKDDVGGGADVLPRAGVGARDQSHRDVHH